MSHRNPQLSLRHASAEFPSRADTGPLRLGLLAGGGEFPVRFARSARQAGHFVYGLGVAGMASDELFSACDEFRFAPLARMGKAIRLLRKARVDRVVMAGKIEKTVLFHPFRWLRLLPDWRTIHMWYRFARHVMDVSPELATACGVMAKLAPGAKVCAAIADQLRLWLALPMVTSTLMVAAAR